jgi:hypothetical protein
MRRGLSFGIQGRFMEEYWTPPLSDEGSDEVREEQQTRPKETKQRIEYLERIRAARRNHEGNEAAQPIGDRPRHRG